MRAIDYEEYISIYNLVIELIRNFKDDLLNATVTEQYKKVKREEKYVYLTIL